MAEKFVVNLYSSGRTYSEGTFTDKNIPVGDHYFYDDTPENNIFKKLTYDNGKVISSITYEDNREIIINKSNNRMSFISKQNNISRVNIVGIVFNDKNETSCSGTTTSLNIGDITLRSTLTTNEKGDYVLLNKLECITSFGNKLHSSYRDEGIEEIIFESIMTDASGIEIVRKVYLEGNENKPLFMKLRNYKEEEIHGFYKGTQVPKVGGTIENLE